VQEDSSSREPELAKKRGGSQALGVLLILLALVLYQSNALVAAGVGLLGLYLAFGGKL